MNFRYKNGILILIQLILFRNYLFPTLTNSIVVKGISCTCPDAKVLSSKLSLKSNTPDSLLKYNLDFSEIYFTNRISTSSDLMGVNEYIVKGRVIGKKSIDDKDNHYYPLFKIESYSETFLYEVISILLKLFVIAQIYLFIRSLFLK